MTCDARKPKARYAVFNCPVCAAGMTAAATRGHVPAELRRWGEARRDEKGVGRRGSAGVVEVGSLKPSLEWATPNDCEWATTLIQGVTATTSAPVHSRRSRARLDSLDRS
jgi:hypothetical protein